MPQNDAVEAARKIEAAIARLGQQLEARRKDIARVYAEEVLQQAQRNAASRPTPQARMAATAVRVSALGHEASVGGSAGTRVYGRGGSPTFGEVGPGSEYGSTIYRQFGPRQGRGAWMAPAVAEAPDHSRPKAEGVINQAIKAAIRGLG